MDQTMGLNAGERPRCIYLTVFDCVCSYAECFSHAGPPLPTRRQSPSNSIDTCEGMILSVVLTSTARIRECATRGERERFSRGPSRRESMIQLVAHWTKRQGRKRDRWWTEKKRNKKDLELSYRLRVVAGVSLRSRFTFGAGRTNQTTVVVVVIVVATVAVATSAFIAFAATRLFGFWVEIFLLQRERLLHLLFAQCRANPLIVHKSILMILGVDFDSPSQSIHGRLTFRRQHLRHYSAQTKWGMADLSSHPSAAAAVLVLYHTTFNLHNYKIGFYYL